MKRTKKPLRLLCWLVILLLTLILSGCSLLSEPAQTTPATETPITDKTGTTDATETTAKNNEAEIVSAEGFILEGTSLSLTVPNATESLSFSERITVSDGARWQVFSDPQGQNVIRTKTVVLEPGDNPFYLLVVSGDGKNIALYTVTIRRKPIYTVAFDTDGGTAIAPITVEEDATPSAPTAVPARTGYVFGGWDNDFSAPVTGDLTVKASWTVIDYAITYNLNGGTNAQTNPVTYTVEDAVALAEPTRLGYSFAGWSDNGAIAAGSTGEKAFTASWTAIDYPITYTLNGGTNNEQNPATYTVEGAVVLAEPKRDGYTFLGWSDGGVIAAGSTGEKTFTANWMAETDTPYTVEYYLENLTGDGYDKTLTEPKGGTTDTTATAEQKIFAHFTFLPDESVSEGTIAGDGSLVLKMYYSRDTYTVTFAPNGGTLTDGSASQTVRYGNAAAFPTFARNGYTFAGWDSTEGCDAVAEDLTVTASWTINHYAITYNLDGGTNNENNPATYTVLDEVSLAAPTRTCYTVEDAVTLADPTRTGY
ncbi:MAG: InlB B-repeat-containing protein, partial [Clostridia bacterium]|nr:InlB B-repeat-containing protein [Clostridia bacterium]